MDNYFLNLLETFPKEHLLEKESYYNGFKYVVMNLGNYLCGYVAIPEGHPLAGVNYNDIDDIHCHGGLTYSEDFLTDYSNDEGYWWIGFDCNHGGDTMNKCNVQYVSNECKNIINQINNKYSFEDYLNG